MTQVGENLTDHHYHYQHTYIHTSDPQTITIFHLPKKIIPYKCLKCKQFICCNLMLLQPQRIIKHTDKSPLEVAKQYGNDEIVKLLEAAQSGGVQ